MSAMIPACYWLLTLLLALVSLSRVNELTCNPLNPLMAVNLGKKTIKVSDVFVSFVRLLLLFISLFTSGIVPTELCRKP